MALWSAAPAVVAGSNSITWPGTMVCGIPSDQLAGVPGPADRAEPAGHRSGDLGSASASPFASARLAVLSNGSLAPDELPATCDQVHVRVQEVVPHLLPVSGICGTYRSGSLRRELVGQLVRLRVSDIGDGWGERRQSRAVARQGRCLRATQLPGLVRADAFPLEVVHVLGGRVYAGGGRLQLLGGRCLLRGVRLAGRTLVLEVRDQQGDHQ